MATVTVFEPDTGWPPNPWLIMRESVASELVQVSVIGWPAWTEEGVAVSAHVGEACAGAVGDTVTVALQVIFPPLPLNTPVYVVVVTGLMIFVPDAGTPPTPLMLRTSSASVLSHESTV